MPHINIRCDDTVIALLERLQHAGFGKSKTEVVLSGLCLLSESTLVDLAKAKMAALERAPVVAAKESAVALPPEPACEVCGDAFASGNTRFCAAHRPAIED